MVVSRDWQEVSVLECILGSLNMEVAVEQEPQRALARAGYFFAPHAATPVHPQYDGRGEIHYGETVITMAYVHEHWSPLFTVLDVDLLLDDPFQVVLTLRRA